MRTGGVGFAKYEEPEELDDGTGDRNNVEAPPPGFILNEEAACDRADNDTKKRCGCINSDGFTSLMRPEQVTIDAASNLVHLSISVQSLLTSCNL
jgi:hypothetical protein